jgi:hypothetical protein
VNRLPEIPHSVVGVADFGVEWLIDDPQFSLCVAAVQLKCDRPIVISGATLS